MAHFDFFPPPLPTSPPPPSPPPPPPPPPPSPAFSIRYSRDNPNIPHLRYNIERGRIHYEGGFEIPAMFHFFSHSDPLAISAKSWYNLVIRDPTSFLLKVVGFEDKTEDLCPHFMILTEYSHLTLAHWVCSPTNALTYTTTGGFVHLSIEFSSKLSDVIKATLYMQFRLGIQHGSLSADNIFLVGFDLVKLGMCNLENVGSNICDMQQLVNMVRGFGLSTFPIELTMFLHSLTDNSISDQWMWNNVRNALGHPVFKKGTAARLAYREALSNHLLEMERSTNKTMRRLLKRVRRNMACKLPNYNWVAHVESFDDENQFKKALAFYNYDWTDPLSFARYGRNLKVHREDLTQEEAEDGLNAIYTGYLAICHEVLSGLGVFIETPPF